MFQSRAFLSQPPKRPSPTFAGTLQIDQCETIQNPDARDAPSGLFVVGDELVRDLSDADEPRGDGAINERGTGTPAEGVRVGNVGTDDEATLLLELLDDVPVGLLHEGQIVNQK
jgi:hypothetical protein